MIVNELPPVMLRIAIAESRLDPLAKNPNSSAKGLFQILDGTAKYYGCTGNMYDPRANIDCAKILYQKDGVRPWYASRENWE